MSQPATPEEEEETDLPEQVRVRREKRQRLVDSGRDPYPVVVERSHTLAQVRSEYPDLAPDAATGVEVAVVGRVVFSRNGGRLCFATLQEGDGTRLQVMVSLADVGEEQLASWKSDVDLADFVRVRGEVVASRRGELSVRAFGWSMVAKALRPLPVLHKEMSEEARIRSRSVDLTTRPAAREMVRTRAAVVRSLRETLHRKDFTEVETPVLQTVRGGATARTFATHLNAFDLDVTLRIALELPLKRAVAGGVERVYEIGRIFRNEGADSTHSPEFTMLEAYEAYGSYDTMAELTRELVLDAARAVGRTRIPDSRGGTIDLEQPWRHAGIHDLVSGAVGDAVDPGTPVARLREIADAHQVSLQPSWGAGEVMLELYEKLVEHALLEPTFVRDYPLTARPLARTHRADERLTEAWDLVIAGVELGVAYSELVDPVTQRMRLEEQARLAAGGNAEAMQLDEDFLLAMEHGMPPMGGMGMGVDRLLMLLTGTGIRETILFPAVRPPAPQR